MAACNPNEFGFDVIFAWEDEKDAQNQNAQTDGAINRDDITCAICLLVLREPVQAVDCGHRFCTKCIQKFHLINPGKCPKDWKDIQVFPDVGKKREILSLKIRCQNFSDGCSWQNELREQKEHLKTCGYEQVACNLECGEFVLRKNLTMHVDTVCPMVSHCEYQEFGCTFKGTRTSLEDHMAGNISIHMSLEMKREIRKAKDEFNKELSKRDETLKNVVKEKDKQIELLMEKLKVNEQALAETLKEFKQADEISKTENQKMLQRRKEECNKAIADFQHKAAQASKHTEEMMMGKWREANRSINELAASNQSNKKEITTLSERQKIEDSFKKMEQKLAEKGAMTMQVLTMVRGPFVWEIKNFKTKFDNAKIHNTKLTSNLFLTEHGYKGQLNMYINGHKIAKGKYTSIYFQIAVGPFDDMLKWPMPYKRLIFKLIINRKDMKTTFSESDENEGQYKDNFQRPLQYTGHKYSLGPLYGFDHKLIQNVTNDDIVEIQFDTVLR